MKIIHSKFVALSIIFIILMVSCGMGQKNPSTSDTQTEPATASSPTAVALPQGLYNCQGHEYGLIASIGMVTFHIDGTFVDQAFYYPPSPGTIGTWHFESQIKQIRFSENIDFTYAEYNEQEDTATLYLRQGVTRAHAEGGVIQCYKNQK